MSANDLDIEEYLERPYPISVVRQQAPDGREIWFAEVDDLPGCMSRGDTAAGAIDGVRAAMGAWISVALEKGQQIPEPRPVHEYSGRFVVRVPRTLHGQLARRAQQETVSLNQLVANALAAAVGWRAVPAERSADAAEAAAETKAVAGY